MKHRLSTVLLLAILFIAMISSFYTVYAIDSSFGYGVVGGSNINLGTDKYIASRYELTENANITNIGAYTQESQGYYIGIYSDSNGHPDSLLYTSDYIWSDGAQWKTAFPNITLDAGFYWLALTGGGANFIVYDAGTTNQTASATHTFATFASTAETPSNYYNYKISIYANYSSVPIDDLIITSPQTVTGGTYANVYVFGTNNVVLDGVTIQGNLSINTSSYITIENSVFTNGSIGADATIDHISIINNTINTNVVNSIWLDGNDSLILNNNVNGTIWTYTVSKNVTIAGNTITVPANISFIGGNTGIDIDIENNTMYGQGGDSQDAINLASMENYTIKGNTLTDGTKNGINIDLSGKGLIENNTIIGIAPGFAGIKAFADFALNLSVIIRNNTIDGLDAQGDGIGINSGSNLLVTGNYINNTRAGISFWSTTNNASATYNVIENSATAMAMDGVVHYSTFGNNTITNDTYSFFIKDTATMNEIGNNIVTGTGDPATNFGGTFNASNYWHDNGFNGEPMGAYVPYVEPTPSPTPTPSASPTNVPGGGGGWGGFFNTPRPTLGIPPLSIASPSPSNVSSGITTPVKLLLLITIFSAAILVMSSAKGNGRGGGRRR